MSDINGWAGDKGETLLREGRGCGALTDWYWVDLDTGGEAILLLPFLLSKVVVLRMLSKRLVDLEFNAIIRGLGIGDWSDENDVI